MIVGKVVGSIVSTRKSDKLIGQKFMIVEPVHHRKTTYPRSLQSISSVQVSGKMCWWHKEARPESAAAKKQHLLMRQ